MGCNSSKTPITSHTTTEIDELNQNKNNQPESVNKPSTEINLVVENVSESYLPEDGGVNQLQENERLWACELKEAVENTSDEKNFPLQSDFMYAQYTIIAKGDKDKALSRIRKTTEFLRSYEMEELTSEEVIDWFEANLPGFLLAAGDDNLGRPSMCMSYQNFFPKSITSEKDMLYLVKLCFDMMEACVPDIESTRKGMVFVCDCSNIGWANFSEEMERTFAELYQDAYPIRFDDLFMVNAPFLMKILIKICSVFLKKKIRDRMHLTSLSDLKGSELYDQGLKLPSQLGGRSEMSFKDWLLPRLERRAQSILEFKL